MPKTPVNENDGANLSERQIGTTRKVLLVEPVAKTQSVHDASDDHLGPGIPPFDSPHDFATSFATEGVQGSCPTLTALIVAAAETGFQGHASRLLGLRLPR